MTSLRCTNVIGAKCRRQITLLKSICANLSPKNCLLKKKNFWKLSSLEVYYVLLNVILKYTRISEKLLPTFHASSGTSMLLEMTLVRFWKEMSRKRDSWLSLGSNLTSCYLLENGTINTPLLLFYLGFWLICKKMNASCNTLQWSASTTSSSLQWMLGERKTRI